MQPATKGLFVVWFRCLFATVQEEQIRSSRLLFLGADISLCRINISYSDAFIQIIDVVYSEALELVGIMESDTEILDRLFSMFDVTGNDQINYKEFVGGLAPLCHGTVEEKLACELCWCFVCLLSVRCCLFVSLCALRRLVFLCACFRPADKSGKSPSVWL